jgi:hypothetical protein
MDDKKMERLRPWIELLEAKGFKQQPSDYFLYFRRPMINALIRLQPRGERAYDDRWSDQNGVLQFNEPMQLLAHLQWLISDPQARLYDAPRFTTDNTPGRDANELTRMNEAFDCAMFERFASYNNDPESWRRMDAKKREDMVAEEVLSEFEEEEED